MEGGMSQQIAVEGMSCEHCEQRVEDELADTDGVTSASADHDAGTVTVDGSASTDAIAEAIEAAGYEVVS